MCTKFVLINKLVLKKIQHIHTLYVHGKFNNAPQDSSCINWIVINAIKNYHCVHKMTHWVKNCHQTRKWMNIK